MTVRMLLSLAITLVATGPILAQDKNAPDQSPARQSAPAQSSHAPGHDAQAGKPSTGETTDIQRPGAESTGASVDKDNDSIRSEAQKQKK